MPLIKIPTYVNWSVSINTACLHSLLGGKKLEQATNLFSKLVGEAHNHQGNSGENDNLAWTELSLTSWQHAFLRLRFPDGNQFILKKRIFLVGLLLRLATAVSIGFLSCFFNINRPSFWTLENSVAVYANLGK